MSERNERKLMSEIGFPAFLEAQDRRCPLCFDDTWEVVEHTLFEQIPYAAPTWDHVFAWSRGGHRLPGNALVVHNGCNARKAKSAPTEAEIAILRIVNERLGWDGFTYRNTEGGQKRYARLADTISAISKNNPDRLLELPNSLLLGCLWWARDYEPARPRLPDRPLGPERDPNWKFDASRFRPGKARLVRPEHMKRRPIIKGRPIIGQSA